MPLPDSFALKNTSIRIPSRGLGTFQVDSTLYPDGSVKASVLAALKAGYRHIDAALAYGWGAVEREIGEALREAGLPREELFIVSKLHQVHHHPDDVEHGLDLSLKNLGLEYVDLYLMHFPYAYKRTADFGTVRDENGKPIIDYPLTRAYDTTWAAMEAMVDKGKTKLIEGVSNFSSPKLERLLKTARIFPVVNQVELNPYFPQKGLFDFCQRHEIHVTAYGPLGCMPVPQVANRKGPGPLEDEEVKRAAVKYKRTPAQILLAFMIARGASVIPKSNSPARIVENFDCMFELEPADYRLLDNLVGEKGERGQRHMDSSRHVGFDFFSEERDEP